MSTCLIADCGRSASRRGLCQQHYKRMMGHKQGDPSGPIATHWPRMPGVPLYEVVMARTDVRGPDDCWPYMAGTTVKGYPRIGKTGYGHRIVCEKHHGPAPADKPYVLHSCDNPPCCNPAHLRWGSQAENLQDARDRGRFPQSNQRR